MTQSSPGPDNQSWTADSRLALPAQNKKRIAGTTIRELFSAEWGNAKTKRDKTRLAKDPLAYAGQKNNAAGIRGCHPAS